MDEETPLQIALRSSEAAAGKGLHAALAPLDGSKQAIVEALTEALSTIDLDNISTALPEELLNEDTTVYSRLTYVVGLKRMLAYLRRDFDPTDAKVQAEQAKVAMAYIAHAERVNLSALQLGRSVADSRLIEEVNSLRRDMDQLAAYKARAIHAAKKTDQ